MKPIVCLYDQLRRQIIGLVGEQTSIATIIGANFSAGFVAGSIAAFVTCPLDVAKTRRQIEVILPINNISNCLPSVLFWFISFTPQYAKTACAQVVRRVMKFSEGKP